MARAAVTGVVGQVTRVVLLVRLVSLLLVVASPQVPPVALVAQSVIGIIAFWLLWTRSGARLVDDHPWLVFLDTLLLAVVTLLSGADSPFVLTFMTSAILVGLWARPLVGFGVVALLVLMYVMFWVDGWAGHGVSGLAIPFGFVVLWWLGFAVQEAGAAEARARTALQRAVSVAASSEERSRLARDMHDTLAKSLQALHLTAAALPTLVERDPSSGLQCAGEIKELSIRAIDEARSLMTHLRREPEGESLEEMVRQMCRTWEEFTGIPVILDLDPTVEVTDELVRYELLMAMGEALENVHRHAQAGEVQVQVRGTRDTVTLDVVDNGVGVAEERLVQAEREGHFGRRGMSERLARVGGDASFASTPGHGVRVRFTAPRRGLIEVQRERR